jgi:hypothetical protein
MDYLNKKECSLDFGSWSFNAEQYDLDFYDGQVTMMVDADFFYIN